MLEYSNSLTLSAVRHLRCLILPALWCFALMLVGIGWAAARGGDGSPPPDGYYIPQGIEAFTFPGAAGLVGWLIARAVSQLATIQLPPITVQLVIPPGGIAHSHAVTLDEKTRRALRAAAAERTDES